MSFYQMLSPRDYNYAQFGIRGTWTPSKSEGLCPECTRSSQIRVPPLIIEWEPGSDLIGDFIWSGISFELVSKQFVALELKKHFSGFDIKEIKMFQDNRLKMPKATREGTQKRIYLPYEGPTLSELWVDSWFPLDEAKSNVKLEKTCSTCGYRYYIPKRSGLVLDHNYSTTYDIFRIAQFPGWIFCTEKVKEYIEARKYTNIIFINVS